MSGGAKWKFKKSHIKVIVSIVLVVALVCGYGVYAAQPVEYQASEAYIGDMEESVDVSGNIKGVTEETYYANVNAPISKFHVELGASVSVGEKIIEYETTDIKEAYELSNTSYKALESAYRAQVAESAKQSAKHTKAQEEKNKRSVEYQTARAGQKEMNQARYEEGFVLQEKQEAYQNKIAEINAEITANQSRMTVLSTERAEVQLWMAELQRTMDQTNASDVETMKDHADKLEEKTKKIEDLTEETSDLQAELAKLQKENPSMMGIEATPAENEANLYYNQYIEDVLRSYTEAVTEEKTAEGGILNEAAKEQLFQNSEAGKLQAEAIARDLENAEAGIIAKQIGIVTQVHTTKNAYVAEGDPLFTITATDEFVIPVLLSKYDITHVKEGQRATISFGDEMFEGIVKTVYRLAQTDESDKTKVKADIRMINGGQDVILGMEADVIIYTREKKDTLLVSSQGVYTDEQGSYCYVIEEERIKKQYIKTGMMNAEIAEITEGLNKGAVVITDAITDELIGEKAYAKLN